MTRRSAAVSALSLLLASASLPGSAGSQSPGLLGEPVRSAARAEPARSPDPASGAESAGLGLSGKLRAVVAGTLDLLDFTYLASLAGNEAPRRRWSPLSIAPEHRLLGEALTSSALRAPAVPGIWKLESERPARAYLSAPQGGEAPLHLITRVPFDAKSDGYLNGYHIGRYPAEGSGRSDRYAPPGGFIEVTPENQDFYISKHFQLRQFLTKDQRNVWPKYLALDLRLIDKLELVLQELNEMGVRAERMHVMSGFRTPQYNGPGGNGRAKLSRHTYGDAADVWVDNDADGYIDDLNGDGRRDLHDAAVILKAVDRVEAKYPELVGGAGLYVDNGAHGPFIHIDVRGQRSRW